MNTSSSSGVIVSEHAYVEPRQLFTGAQGRVSFALVNQSATATINLHREYERPADDFQVVPLGSLPMLEWAGGRLWISASADNTPYMILRSEPGRGDLQLQEGVPAGPSSPGGGAPDPVVGVGAPAGAGVGGGGGVGGQAPAGGGGHAPRNAPNLS